MISYLDFRNIIFWFEEILKRIHFTGSLTLQNATHA